jgi:hypothetical protein
VRLRAFLSQAVAGLVLLHVALPSTPSVAQDLSYGRLEGCWRWYYPPSPTPRFRQGHVDWCFQSDGTITGVDLHGGHGVDLQHSWEIERAGTLRINDNVCALQFRHDAGVEYVTFKGCARGEWERRCSKLSPVGLCDPADR